MGSEFIFPKLENVLVGQFIVKRQLSADGNMSAVYEAWSHPKAEQRVRRVALKMSRNDKPAYEQFLLREVKQLRSLRHPGIVHICPIIMPNGVSLYSGRAEELTALFNGEPPFYYAMELLDGGSLHNHLRGKSIYQFSIQWRVELLYQIATTLDFLHSAKVAHRDIKPDNIVFRYAPRPNERPQAVLIDFGLWAHGDEDLVPTAYRAGSLQYLSPERVIAQRRMVTNVRTSRIEGINHVPSDIWALGVIAYELFHGVHPFAPFNSEEDLEYRLVHTPHRPPNTWASMDRLINDMLQKIREDRPVIGAIIQRLDTEIGVPPPRI